MRALILEGGAMRGIFTAAVLDGLAHRGDTDFDLVIGVSSGAYCAASFLAGQHGRVRRIVREHMTGSNYANPWRMLRGGSFVDQDFLMGPITLELDPLDVGALRRARAAFEVVTAHARTGRPCYLPAQDDDCLDAIHASGAIPVFYRGAPKRFRGEDHFDGSVADPVPIRRAVALGATRLTVVRTRAPWDADGPLPLAARLAIRATLGEHPAIRRAIGDRHRAYREARELLRRPPAGVEITLWAPPRGFPVTRFTRDPRVVLEGYRVGREAVLRGAATVTGRAR
jgi:predicted patatin/cPLA2 family phospholipase